MQHIQLDNKPHSAHRALTDYLQIPLIDLDDTKKSFINEAKLPSTEFTKFGVIAVIDTHASVLRKTVSLIISSWRIWRLSRKLKKDGAEVVGRYAVFPQVADPVVIYELGSPSEHYCNKYILPAFPPGLNGKLRWLIMRLVKFHPSVAGIILVAKK